MKWIFMYVLAAGLTALSFSAYSVDFSFLKNTPGQSFTDQDWKLMGAATDKALNTFPNGKKLAWRNPKTGNSGYVQPLSTVTKDGRKCRQLKIVNRNKNDADQYVFLYCKYADGWKIPG